MARKGTKSLSRTSDGGPVGFNECRAGLAYHAQVLGENLKELGPRAPLKYYKALLALNMAYGLVKNIGCAGPFMSFELPLLKGEVKPEKIKPLRRRR